MSSLDLSQDTLRQRRNLILISGLIIFIELGNVSFGDSVNFLGASLKINRPEIIRPVLNVVLAYYLWRFYQYFVSDNAYSHLCRQFKEYLENHTRGKIVALICRPRDLKSLAGEYKYENLEKVSLRTYSIRAVSNIEYDPKTGDAHEIAFKADISRISIQLTRLGCLASFIFRGRILTDYFVPYLLTGYAILIQIV